MKPPFARRPRILLVDDEPLNIEVLRAALGNEYSLSFATSGEEALRVAGAEPQPALILLDIMMEGMDGFEVCARLKADHRTANIPVIFLTALDDRFNEGHGLQIGAVDYIHKPFSPAIVQARVRLHVQLRERTLELHRTQEQLRRLAAHDELTGLPNRRYLHQQLQQAIAKSRRDTGRLAVMVVDLDRFKPINDTFGHAAGDHVLKTIAQRLRSTLREEDSVARVGGDEFVAILGDVQGTEPINAAAERILHSIGAAIPVNGREVTVGASIGIAMFPDHSHDMGTLLEHADAACYKAKHEGRNNYHIYTRSVHDGSSERIRHAGSST